MKRIIYTDDPQREIWSLLGLLESKTFVYDKLKQVFPLMDEGVLKLRTDGIIYSVRQAREFFFASDQISLLTRPLLLSYGMLNLGKAVVLYKSPENTIVEGLFKSHGLSFMPSSANQSLGNEYTKIKEAGTYVEILSFFGQRLYPNKKISIKDLISQIPDLADLYSMVYKEYPNVSPVKYNGCYHIGVSTDYFDQYNGKIERMKQYLDDNKVKIISFGFDTGYTIQIHLPMGKSITDLDLSVSSIADVEYFRIFPLSESQPLILKETAIYYLLIFSYGMLARYHATRWGKYIDPNLSNEAELIHKSIYISKMRYLHLIVNSLFEEDIQFSNAPKMSERELEDRIYKVIQQKLPDEVRKYI